MTPVSVALASLHLPCTFARCVLAKCMHASRNTVCVTANSLFSPVTPAGEGPERQQLARTVQLRVARGDWPPAALEVLERTGVGVRQRAAVAKGCVAEVGGGDAWAWYLLHLRVRMLLRA